MLLEQRSEQVTGRQRLLEMKLAELDLAAVDRVTALLTIDQARKDTKETILPSGGSILSADTIDDQVAALLAGPRSLPSRRELGVLCLWLKRLIMAGYVTLTGAQDGASAAGGRSCCLLRSDSREVPGDSRTIWLAAGANFLSDLGALFRSVAGGATWARVDMGVTPKTTMFAVAFDERQPRRMHCATSGGEVFASFDGNRSWIERPLPSGASQVYAMACA